MNELFQTLKDNLSFVLVCVIAAAAVIGVSLLAERTLLKGKMVKMNKTRRIATCAMLAAAAGLLMLFEFPLPFAPFFYEVDFSELPVLIGAFSMGPVAGTVIELVKVLVKLVLKGTSTAFVGDFANFFIGCTLVVPASIIYHMNKSRKNAALALVAGTVVMAVVGSAFNAVYLIPKFASLYGMPLESIIAIGTEINPRITSCWSMAIWAVVPFNLVKGAAVSVITMFIYKPLSGIIKGKN
ncbi:MAG: ECF transporter S component [Clostridia bacterium]